MEDKEQVIDCFEEQLKNALNNTTNDCCISINYHREIWEIILKAIQGTKQALTTKSEKEQALEIIVKKGVNIMFITRFNYSREKYNYMGVGYGEDELTQEEYNLVSKVVKEITEEEKHGEK